MKKTMVLVLVVLMVSLSASTAFAARPPHPPTPEPSINVAPIEAAYGLHRACPNLNEEGKAFHIFLFRLGPGPHQVFVT